MVGDSIVKLNAGELATGRDAIAKHTGLTSQNVRTSLKKLESLGILTSKPTNKYSIISITNWDSYQQTNQQVTSSQPASNQQTNHKQEVKKVKNVKEYISFDDFWHHWPKKTDKQKAEKAWNKLKVTDELYQQIINHCTKAYLTTEKKFIPNPSTYLNNARWEDEIISNQPPQEKADDCSSQYNRIFTTAHQDSSSPVQEDAGALLESLDIEDSRQQ